MSGVSIMNGILRITTEGTFGLKVDNAPQHYMICETEDGYILDHIHTCIGFDPETNEDISDSFSCTLPKAMGDDIFAKLSTVRIPPFPQHHMGCDGGFTEIEMGGYDGNSSFRWWSSPPEEWQEFDNIVQQILEEITEHLEHI